jgi:alpha-L-fucosidase
MFKINRNYIIAFFLYPVMLFPVAMLHAQTGVVVTSEQKRKVGDSVSSADSGVIVNSSFEQAGLADYKVERWKGSADITLDSTVAYDGRHSLKVVGKDASVTIAQNIPVPRNTIYEFSFWIKMKDLKGGGKTGLLVDGNTDKFFSFQSRNFKFADDKWHEVKHYIHTGAATKLQLQLAYEMWNGGGTGTVWFDGLSLKEIAKNVDEYVISPSRRLFPGVTLESQMTTDEWFGTMEGGYPRKYRPTVESLRQYTCPEWFRDAKFGIYLHWGIYSIPEMECWFGRLMYIKGTPQYKYMKEKFGNLQEYGYKDLIPLWKAEKFDPDSLVRLFKRAGAKYVTPVAVHHDNFDLWNSRYNKWNSVNMGPKMDIVGMWRKAILKAGLRFGVTTHLERSYSWFNTNKLSDEGGKFDGSDPKYADFYQQNNGEMGHTGTIEADPKWRFEWACRLMDLIDSYHPDLLYFDGSVPFRGEDQGTTGMNVLAYYYNKNSYWHHGTNEGVMNIKNSIMGYNFTGVATLDFERSNSPEILPDPWQTDDAIGPWSYQKGAKYKSVNEIIDKLVDIVSKNGNYLLDVPPKADGSLDQATIDILKGIGKWMDINGEAIYSTRPWTQAEDGNVRFTRSKDNQTLYAICLEKPADNNLVIPVLKSNKMKVNSVALLGYGRTIKWKQKDDGLHILLPKTLPGDFAWSFKIQ